MFYRRRYFVRFQDPRDLRRTLPCETEVKDPPDNGGGRLVNVPDIAVFHVFHVSIRSDRSDAPAGSCFGRPDGTDFLAGLGCVPFVEYIGKRHELRSGIAGRVHILLNGNEPYSERRILDLQVLSRFQIVSAEA